MAREVQVSGRVHTLKMEHGICGGKPKSKRQPRFVPQPRVAESARLPWAPRVLIVANPNGVAPSWRSTGTTPLGLRMNLISPSQSSSFLATLGWRPLPRWGKAAKQRTPGRARAGCSGTQTSHLIPEGSNPASASGIRVLAVCRLSSTKRTALRKSASAQSKQTAHRRAASL